MADPASAPAETAPGTGLSFRGVRHLYGAYVALKGIDLDLNAGASLALVGPDGVGKSTLLALLAGSKAVQGGVVRALGVDMSVRRDREGVQPRIAYMPQGLGRNLYPNLTVGENITFFARLFGASPIEARARLAPLLAGTGLAPFEDRLMRKLSGGMKQKLGLCCALVHDPDLLILDEPTTGIDPLSRRQFWELVDAIKAERPQLCVIVATSDMDEAARFDRVVLMNDGAILADGSPAELLARTNQPNLERAFIALLPERPDGVGQDHDRVAIAADAPVAIEAKGLTRRFGDFIAVNDVNFTIRKGEIFGFLGSNGCGKSTTMKMLTGLLPASSGEALLFGKAVAADDMETRRRVGYMSQSFSLYGELTVQQNLDLHARLFALSGEVAKARIADLVADFDLGPHLEALSDSLPLGVRQRLQLAVAILHDPELLILDEPTSGVDPVARDQFWDRLERLSRDKGVTIFVSTHFMTEAERCDRISFMHAGRVIATGTPGELKAAKGVATLEEAFIAYMEMGGRKDAPVAMPKAVAGGQRKPAAFSVRRMGAYAWREAIEMRRDPVRLTFALLGTALLMLIFGFGITLDVDHLRFAVLDRDQTPESRAYVDEYAHSPYFILEAPLAGPAQLEEKLRANAISFAIEIPAQFGSNLRGGKDTEVFITVDGAMPFRAETIVGYVESVHLRFIQDAAQLAGSPIVSPANLVMRYRYNQAFRSLDAMVPATIALLLIFIPAVLTALGVVTEKEMGSITNLYVTPVTKVEFLLGKQLPYAALAVLNFLVMVVMALTLFGVPLKGSFLGLALAAIAYVLATTAFGLFISIFTKTQVAALFATSILTMVPASQFSGLLQPVPTLDGVARVIGTFFPTTYFMRASVGAFTKGLSLLDLMPFILASLAFWPVLLAAALLLLKKQEV
ncbi:ribosome-associated ATPase/putative transporter RbbA [Aquabacter sp. L1I39]|uniref:ribosome-associated ATPase/putative transporter RbbA n=1 Tax=Aquabacter sp. L1I39 TaxID=2820278 RepID=UPI001ADB2720|nr:ribosome-associated ATPase/putative transporter RbbA [Aquabacter sp. L1I39]QTL04061.1 ribosome-associated ATPase/putative transporter RbbA [Aquabacter sp. L1I39]